MALFIDGPPATLGDLTSQDSGLLEVCRVEQINASTKLQIAHEEMSTELMALFQRQSTLYGWNQSQTKLDVEHLAVTPTLKRWHCFHSLAVVYRDCYFNQMNDRYRAKWDQYEILTRSARDQFYELGAGIVLDPLHRPNCPLLAETEASETGGCFYFGVTCLNETCEESECSPITAFTVAAGKAINLQLSPPDGNVVTWNIYAGTRPDNIYRQNEPSVSFVDDWTFYPSTLLTAGVQPGAGQPPNVFRAMQRRIQRG